MTDARFCRRVGDGPTPIPGDGMDRDAALCAEAALREELPHVQPGERHLAVGCVEDVGRNGEPGRVAAQPAHDVHARLDGRPQVGRPADELRLVDVVGPDSHLQQFPVEFGYRFDGVVNALHQHHLIFHTSLLILYINLLQRH